MTKWLLGAVGAGAALVLSIAALPSEPSPALAAGVSQRSAEPTATTATTAIPVAPTATTTTTATPTATAPDRFATRDAIEATTDLKALQQVDITKDGYVAAAAIARIGKLASTASTGDQRDAIRTLDRWLRDESKRNAPEATGNVSIIVDALEETKSSDAIAPLVSALDSHTLPLHIETRIVQALTTLNAKSAAPSVERFAKRVEALTPSDEFEKALASEASSAASSALSQWR